MARWWIAQAGLLLTVFAVVALSGPGRIDIVDGQTRYEVARSLIDHGDLVIRDPNVWFAVFPGRDGQRYAKYRFPQSLAGVIAILVADHSGPVDEGRRHFYFTMTSAIASAILAVTYASVFRHLGYGMRASLLWATGGIFCTPSWFYGTSTFDDMLGTTSVILAVVIALAGRQHHTQARAIIAGLALGLAFNCKEPLGIFILPVLSAIYDSDLRWQSQWSRLAIIGSLLVLSVAVYLGYDLYKFPPGSTAGHAEIMKSYAPVWASNPMVGLLAILFSVGAGAPFYNPPILICLSGLRAWWNSEKLFCLSLLMAIAIFILFISSLTFFKGDPAWGPRYLTPIFAVLWIFAPASSRFLRKWMVVTILGLGLLIQINALCIDPHRLYIEHGLPSAFYVSAPDLYFNPSISHLINRPREIVDVLSHQGDKAECYSPSPTPTFTFPVIDSVEKGPAAIRKYHILKGFRFWWTSFQYLDPLSRPVDLKRTVGFLIILAVTGLILQAFGICNSQFAIRDPENLRVKSTRHC
jgi:hypothetical protein